MPRWLQVLLFLLIYGLYQWGYQSLRASDWDGWFIHSLTAAPAASLLGLLAPADGVVALGHKLAWANGSLALRAGCDGFEILGLFVAAMLVSDISWRRGMAWLMGGCLVIWGLNQARILALYAAVRYQREWFDSLHTIWAPLALIACVAAIYVCALRDSGPGSSGLSFTS